jgi:hypothetical protein
MHEQPSRFQRAVGACPSLKLRAGLQAITTANRRKITPENPRSVTGSVNLDEDLKEQFPNDNRWDYVVGYMVSDTMDKVFFIEVHPAETSEIRCVINKVRNLRKWAVSNAPDLWNMTIPREIHWISSGKNNLRLNDSYRRILAMEGLGSPKQHLELG